MRSCCSSSRRSATVTATVSDGHGHGHGHGVRRGHGQRRPRSAPATSRGSRSPRILCRSLASANVACSLKLTSTLSVRPPPRDVPSAPAAVPRHRSRALSPPPWSAPATLQTERAIGPPFHPSQATKFAHAPPSLPARRYAMDGPSAEPPMNAEEMEEGSFRVSTGAAHLPHRSIIPCPSSPPRPALPQRRRTRRARALPSTRAPPPGGELPTRGLADVAVFEESASGLLLLRDSTLDADDAPPLFVVGRAVRLPEPERRAARRRRRRAGRAAAAAVGGGGGGGGGGGRRAAGAPRAQGVVEYDELHAVVWASTEAADYRLLSARRAVRPCLPRMRRKTAVANECIALLAEKGALTLKQPTKHVVGPHHAPSAARSPAPTRWAGHRPRRRAVRLDHDGLGARAARDMRVLAAAWSERPPAADPNSERVGEGAAMLDQSAARRRLRGGRKAAAKALERSVSTSRPFAAVGRELIEPAPTLGRSPPSVARRASATCARSCRPPTEL